MISTILKRKKRFEEFKERKEKLFEKLSLNIFTFSWYLLWENKQKINK